MFVAQARSIASLRTWGLATLTQFLPMSYPSTNTLRRTSMRKKSAIARETPSRISLAPFFSLIARSIITTMMSTMISTTPNTLQKEKYKSAWEAGMNCWHLTDEHKPRLLSKLFQQVCLLIQTGLNICISSCRTQITFKWAAHRTSFMWNHTFTSDSVVVIDL